jgi:hypothetical protein
LPACEWAPALDVCWCTQGRAPCTNACIQDDLGSRSPVAAAEGATLNLAGSHTASPFTHTSTRDTSTCPAGLQNAWQGQPIGCASDPAAASLCSLSSFSSRQAYGALRTKPATVTASQHLARCVRHSHLQPLLAANHSNARPHPTPQPLNTFCA